MYTLTINGNTPEELYANIEKMAGVNKGGTPANAPQQPPTVQPPTVQPPTVQPPTVQPPTVQPAPAVPTSAPAYTLDALARAGAALAQSGKMQEACDLLARYGVQNVNQLKSEQYGAFATELRALGAQL